MIATIIGGADSVTEAKYQRGIICGSAVDSKGRFLYTTYKERLKNGNG